MGIIKARIKPSKCLKTRSEGRVWKCSFPSLHFINLWSFVGGNILACFGFYDKGWCTLQYESGRERDVHEMICPYACHVTFGKGKDA